MLCAVVVVAVVISSSSDDGPSSFVSHDGESAVFVHWTRTGDDVSGSLSFTEVTQPQASDQTGFFSTPAPAGQIKQQSETFTGTVHDDSVRLLIGSGSLSNRINGRLEGDTLELTIPQDSGAVPLRLKPGDRGDYTRAVQQIRDHERRRKAAANAARVRKRRADTIEITRAATAFQRALHPRSPDDPCRYVTPDVKQRLRSFDTGSSSGSCATALRERDAALQEPVFKAPLGVATITFGPLPPLGISLDGGPPGAVVTWRPKPAPDSLEQGRTTPFIEHDGRWLVYRCCP